MYAFRFLTGFFLIALCASSALASTASDLFNDLKQQVYQIRVIDSESDEKYSIGSGFRVSENGLIATNFHVISSYVHEPDKYRLELVHQDESVSPATVRTFDVIHDLAILNGPSEPAPYLPMGSSSMEQGDIIYSIGNPHDLGMSIIEGYYNGLLQYSRYQKILFSGSLNPGMSGGPAVDQKGNVIGINVSTGGDQISFLVPVEYLVALIHQSQSVTGDEDFTEVIADALYHDQDSFYSDILSDTFSTAPLGDLNLPHDLSKALKCWGHTTETEEESGYKGVHQHCHSEDEIYISDELHTGDLYFDYEWITNNDLNPIQFYRAVTNRYGHSTPENAYGDAPVTDYRCHSEFTEISDHLWKASVCMRAYTEFSDLYDASLLMASLDDNDKAAVLNIGASGISRSNALLLFRRIMESIEWKK